MPRKPNPQPTSAPPPTRSRLSNVAGRRDPQTGRLLPEGAPAHLPVIPGDPTPGIATALSAERPSALAIPEADEGLPPSSRAPAAVSAIEHERQMEALVAERALASEGVIETQAMAMGYDPAAWRQVVTSDPNMAADLLSAHADKQAQARRENPEAFATYASGGRTEAEQKKAPYFEHVDRLRPPTLEEIRRLAVELLPEEMLGTHKILWRAPEEDGLVYSWEAIRNEDVREKLNSGSFTALPRGPFAPEPKWACDVQNTFGISCHKKMRTKADLELHKKNKHNTVWQAEERAATRDLARVQVEAMSAMMDEMREDRRERRQARAQTVTAGGGGDGG